MGRLASYGCHKLVYDIRDVRGRHRVGGRRREDQWDTYLNKHIVSSGKLKLGPNMVWTSKSDECQYHGDPF